jgi:hypothetical protein
MSKATQLRPLVPIRTLTVCEGRATLGFIHEMGAHHFTAELFATGEDIGGVYPTTGEAAQAINEANKRVWSAAQ